MTLPFTPYNQRLMAMAYASLQLRPSAEAIIGHHIDTCGETFRPWTAEGDARFRRVSLTEILSSQPTPKFEGYDYFDHCSPPPLGAE